MTEIAVAFDVGSLDQALALDSRLGEGDEIAKVGLALFGATGPEVVRALKARGRRVFLDLKLHDIPNTVHGAAAAAARLGADLLTVHALGGEPMIAAAVAGVAAGGGGTRVLAVTLLTSLDASDPPPGLPRPLPVLEVAAEMLAAAVRAGAMGIVCSARDLPGLRERHRGPFYAVTPGIRGAGMPSHDQRRVASVSEAVAAGSNLLVLGRAITEASDPRAALEAVRIECRAAGSMHRS